MIEVLGLIASAIAIATGIFAVRRRLFPSQVVSSESFTKAMANFEYYYNQWQAANYSVKHKHLIPWDDFKEIGRHREKFLYGVDKNAQIFLLVCSVKHGLWGEWWPENINNKNLITGLATLLNGQAGWRPLWRAAYLIQKLSNNDQKRSIGNIPRELSIDIEVQKVLPIIGNNGVIEHLEDITQGSNSHLRDKAFTILEDIKAYHGENVGLKYPNPEST